jgi:hypothetical protein
MVNVREHTRGGAVVSAHSRLPHGSVVGGEFLAPNATPRARHFILMARALMYSDGMEDALRRVVAGSRHLSDGAVPFLAQIITKLAHTARIPLNDVEMHTVVVHLAGSIADLAEKLGRPSATANKRAQVEDIVEGVMAVLSGKVAGMVQQAQAMQGGGGDQGSGEAPQAPLLGSAANG